MAGHIMTGPIAVRGALPGDVLEVRVLDVVLRQDWAWMMIRQGEGSLPEDFTRDRTITVELDLEEMVAELPWAVKVPLQPFFGVIGVAPPTEWGMISSISPRANGGNLDIKELVAGSTVYLPVFREGACLQIGDGHAVQGDGEICLSAAEVSMTGTFELHIRKDLDLRMPRAETEDHFITIGIDEDLDEAAKDALRDMIRLLQDHAKLKAEEAYMLCSLAADVRISQLVNISKGCHVMFPKAILQSAPSRATTRKHPG
jgi:acetamidase/formamidase